MADHDGHPAGGAREELERANAALNERLRELEAADQNLRESRRATLNVLEDAVAARNHLEAEMRERMQAQEALRESEEQFRRAIEDAPIPVIMHAEDGAVLQVSNTWTELTGYRLEDVPTFDAWLNRGYGEGADKVRAHMRELFRGKRRTIDVEFPVQTRHGTVRHWSFSASSPGTLRDGRRFIVGMAVDITERKQAEQELRESEEWRRLSLMTSNLVVWDVNPATGETKWSENTANVLGVDAPESVAETIALMHRDDRDRVTEAIERALRGEAQYDVEHRIVHPATGKIIWIRAQGQLVQGANSGGGPRFVGLTQNVTARKEAEEALRQSEERFRLLVEGARDYAMFLLDLDNKITFWSSGAEKVFGWTEEEAVGQGGDIIFTEEDQHKDEVEKEIQTALRHGRAPDRRWHKRRDGTRIWVDGVLMRLDHADGTPRGFAKIARDASDQHESEEALRHAKEEMEQRVIERTRDVLATNAELERTMAQRQQLERELLEISERETRRIGEDLHDMICQELTATALFLKSNARKFADKLPEASRSLEESAETVNRNVALARELARGLQAVELNAAGLKNALRDLSAQACQNTGMKCHFRAARGARVHNDEVALHLYRVAQEAVTNAIKHSGAKNILISLDHDKTHVCVSVQDDGKGFKPDGKRRGKGLGLHMMRYRANALGGELKIERRKTGGMDVTCKIPIRR